jgi:hypothetical protein
MLGQRSLSLPLNSYDPDIECTLRQLRFERNSNFLGERPTETMADDNRMALRDHYGSFKFIFIFLFLSLDPL